MDPSMCCHCGTVLRSDVRKVTIGRRLRRSEETCERICEKIFHFSIRRDQRNATYLCFSCYTIMGQLNKAHNRWNDVAGPRSIFQKMRKTENGPAITLKNVHGRKDLSLKETVVNYVKRGNFSQLLTTMYKKGGIKARTGVHKSLQYLIRTEVNTARMCFGKTSSKLSQLQEPFLWERFLKEARRCSPLLYGSVTAALTPSKSLAKGKKTARGLQLRPIQGGVLSTILHQVHPQMLMHFQILNGMQLFMSGIKRKTITRFYKLGLCVAYPTVLNILDEVTMSYDEPVKTWRSLWERSVEAKDNVSTQSASECSVMDIDQSTLSDVTMEDDQGDVFEQHPAETNAERDATSDCIMYTICFDNVNISTKARHETLSNQNQQVNMIQTYAVLDRISLPRDAASEAMPSADDILSIPLSSYLPSPREIEEEFNERKKLVGRVLVKWISCFKRKEKEMAMPIIHQYSKQSAVKSTMIPLGVQHKDECRVGDVIDYLTQLNAYVPHVSSPEEKPVKVLLYGDGLSCERIEDAKRARMSDSSKFERFEQYEPAVSDWHKRVLLLQDAYDELLVEKSAKSLGTMCNMKYVMKQRNAKATVKKSFNSSYYFMEMLTESYIVAAALDFLNIESMDDDLGEENIEKVDTIFERVCDHVTRLGTEVPTAITFDMSETESDQDTDEYEYCLCKDDVGGTMVECGNSNCQSGKWFHLECMHISEEDIPKGSKKWYCSANCQPDKKGGGKRSKKDQEKTRDSIYEYTRALLWYGITALSRRDAIRENDGPRIIRHWKYDIIQFSRHRHYKYFKLALNLLTSVQGGSSKRLAHQLTWCRTVNPSGRPGRNIALDLQMEHFNRIFKDCMKTSAGNVTEKTITRNGRLVGTRQKLEEAYDNGVTESNFSLRSDKHPSQIEDMRNAVGKLRSSNLFKVINGRSHSGLVNFKFAPFEIDINKFKEQLQRGQKEIAATRKMEKGFQISSVWAK